MGLKNFIKFENNKKQNKYKVRTGPRVCLIGGKGGFFKLIGR